MAEAAAQLAKFIRLILERVPATVVHEARSFVLDTLGYAIAGPRREPGPLILAATQLFGKGKDATVAGAQIVLISIRRIPAWRSLAHIFWGGCLRRSLSIREQKLLASRAPRGSDRHLRLQVAGCVSKWNPDGDRGRQGDSDA
ncbi:hypothetical protein J2R96_002053 [Bradyrhizobium elkanii]|nr:hypothetical protein [Bradyrhizobium elkanii]